MKTKKNEQEFNKKFILKLTFIIINLLIILFLYYLLLEFGANPLIIILILIFTFLTFTGPLFIRDRKMLYSKMFPKKYRRSRLDEIRQRKDLKKRIAIKPVISETIKPIDLDFKYRKPLIRKCENCGMIVASFVKNCPVCDSDIEG